MARRIVSRRSTPARQLLFPFLAGWRRRERDFKRMIALATILVLVGMITSVPRARYLAAAARHQAVAVVRRAVGIPRDRAEIDAEWARFRRQGVAETRREFLRVYAELDPPLRRLMAYAGNDPASGLLRWGNFNITLLLPSTVFEADETGRSYRLKPKTRAVWLRNLTIQKIPLTFFLVPDGPGLNNAARGTSAIRVEGSVQTTNSWGLRGPEPDSTAPLRGIVLGDSFMQGLFVGDADTPPECLRRYLERELGARVSILNTGHLGYSTEQEYFTLREYVPRFAPRFVVLNLFANDFGGIVEATEGRGDWEEGKYWIERIVHFCEERGILLVTATAPLENQMVSRRFAGNYPGKILNLLETAGTHHVEMTEDFVATHLRLMLDGERAGARPGSSPLFNGVIGDGHFSAIGSELWARAVGRRLVLLLKQRHPVNPS